VWRCLARISNIYLHINSIISGTPRASLVQSYMNIVCHIYIIYIIHSHLRGVSAASNSHYCTLAYTFIHPLRVYVFLSPYFSLFLRLGLYVYNFMRTAEHYFTTDQILYNRTKMNKLFIIITIHCYCCLRVSCIMPLVKLLHVTSASGFLISSQKAEE